MWFLYVISGFCSLQSLAAPCGFCARRTRIIHRILRSTRRRPSCNHLPASLVHTTTHARNWKDLEELRLLVICVHLRPLLTHFWHVPCVCYCSLLWFLCSFVFVALLERSRHAVICHDCQSQVLAIRRAQRWKSMWQWADLGSFHTGICHYLSTSLNNCLLFAAFGSCRILQQSR